MTVFTGSTRKEELVKLEASYRKLLYISILLVVIAVGSLVTALVKMMAPSVALLILLAVLRVTLHKKARNDYQQAVTDAVLTCAVGAKLDQFELSSKGGVGITREDVLEAELVPVRDLPQNSIFFYQGIGGSRKGTEISLNDTTLQQYQHAERKGACVVCGVWMHFVLPKETGRDFRIITKELLPDDIRKEFFGGLPSLTKRNAEDAGLPEGMFLYEAESSSGVGADSTDGFRPLSASFLSSLNSLCRKASGDFGVSVRGNTVDFFFKGRILAPNYRQNKKPDESILQLDPIPEFRSALDMVNALS